MSQRQDTQSGRSSVEDLDVIVDADSHVVGEPFEEILPYVDDRYRGATAVIEAAENVHTEIFSTVRAGPIHPFESDPEEAEEHGIYASNTATSVLDQKETQMAAFGIDYSIVNPTLFTALNSINNPRHAVALANGYNSWMLSEIVDRSDRLKATILVAPQKPELAAEEIDRLADEDDMVGVQVPPTGLVPPAGHEMYYPIYEAAHDHDLPVTMHTNGAMTHTIFPVQYKWNEGWAEDHAMLHPWVLMWTLTTLVLRGVPERFPDIEFVLSEAGIGWIPYTMWRLDDHYLEHSHEAPLLDRLPSEYIKDHFYFTTQPVGHAADNPGHVASIIEMIGSDSIMFSADMPHHDFDTPEELFTRIRSGLDDDAVADVMGETAADLFGLSR